MGYLGVETLPLPALSRSVGELSLAMHGSGMSKLGECFLEHFLRLREWSLSGMCLILSSTIDSASDDTNVSH